jgi:hypothetical protein
MSDHSSSDTIHGCDWRFPMLTSTSDQADSHMINSLLLEPVRPGMCWARLLLLRLLRR